MYVHEVMILLLSHVGMVVRYFGTATFWELVKNTVHANAKENRRERCQCEP